MIQGYSNVQLDTWSVNLDIVEHNLAYFGPNVGHLPIREGIRRNLNHTHGNLNQTRRNLNHTLANVILRSTNVMLDCWECNVGQTHMHNWTSSNVELDKKGARRILMNAKLDRSPRDVGQPET